MIEPTIGATVLVHIGDSFGMSPAEITDVHGNRCIDVTIPTPSGVSRTMTSLVLLQDEDAPVAGDSYAVWPSEPVPAAA